MIFLNSGHYCIFQINCNAMNIEEIRDYCLAKPGVTEGFPFDEVTLVFKVMSKMFALTNLDGEPPTVNLKCDPGRAIELREMYEEVQPGYHMSKKHWNTIDPNGSLSGELFYELIDHSYGLVVESLKKKDREALDSGNY